MQILHFCTLLDDYVFRVSYIHIDAEAYGQAYFGEGNGDIYIVNFQCNGSENYLEDCPASEVGVHDCTHSEDAGVRCQGMQYSCVLWHQLMIQ